MNTRNEKKLSPPNAGWQLIDIRLNKDGTLDILLSSLAVLGFDPNATGKVYPFKTKGLTTIEEALKQGAMVDAWLQEQQVAPAKRTNKAERADGHYGVMNAPASAGAPENMHGAADGDSGEDAPAAPAAALVLEPEPLPKPEVKKPVAPPPAPAKPVVAAKPAGKGPSLGLFDDE